MTQEQKARRYDEAKYIMKEYLESGNAGVIAENTIKKAFPELAESEDERIREEIKVVLANTDLSKFALDYTFADMLAWLEKQGGQNPADKVEHLIPQKGVYYVCIKDYYSADSKTTHTKGKIYKSPCDGYINDDKGFGLSWINSCTENHFRPVKEKDWIVCEQNNVIGKPLQYKEFMNELIQKNIKSLEDRGIVPNLRLWNIFDAKDGDILFAKGSYFKEYVFIYSGMTEDNVLSTYCGFDMVHNNFDTKLSRFGRVEDFETIFPATKEQREQLLKAMADAGYTFDFEKKELKKIEQKHADSYCQENCKGFQETGKCFADGECKAKREAEQKSVWSEEDETYSDHIITAIKSYYTDDKGKENPWREELLRWLKSLKDRVQLQPKQEILEKLEEWLDEYVSDLADVDTASLIYSFTNYLDGKLPKSLRHRSQWKPSEEQMMAIDTAINVLGKGTLSGKQLIELQEDLKNLKGD